MNSFTPGPWEWQSAVKATTGEHVRDRAFLSPGILATQQCSEPSEANAQLIAAAPDLYAMLEKIVSRASLVPCKNGGEDADSGDGMVAGKWRVESSVDGWIADARELLARATGQTQPVAS